MKRPSFFFSRFDCECPQVGNSAPIIPATGAVVADDRYFTLLTAAAGQLMVVPIGSNVQAFLKAGVGVRGFIFYDGGAVAIQPAPSLTLPLLNPAVSNAYPVPSQFKYLVIGTSDPADWRHVAAPTAGAYILQSQNGSWIMVDASTIPGINAIGASGVTTAKGGLMMLVNIGSSNYALQRLAVAHRRVVVGDIDSVSGAAGYKALADAETLTHPLAQFTTLRSREYVGLDVSGNILGGGLEDVIPTGTGATTDGKRLIYSPAGKRFMFSAPQVNSYLQVITPAASPSTFPTTYASMPGGHGAGTSLTFNYPTARIEFQMMQNGAAGALIGLFRDGALLQSFAHSSVLDMGFTYLDTGVPLGAHTYDVRWQNRSGFTEVTRTINQSYLLVQSIG